MENDDTSPYQSTHVRSEIVLGKVLGVVSFVSVLGKVHDVGRTRLYSVNFVVNYPA